MRKSSSALSQIDGGMMRGDSMEIMYLEDARRAASFIAWEPEDDWSRQRVVVAKIIKHSYFEVVLLTVIVMNMVLTVIETDARAAGKHHARMTWSNRIFLMFYVVEMLARVFVLRAEFAYSRLNLLDGVIVLVDTVTEVLSAAIGSVPAASMLRIVRIGRFLRAGHIIVFFPELYWMTRGMFCALKALFWGILLIIVVLMLWSIAAVEVIHPLMDDLAKTGVWDDCPRCHKSFESVAQSLLTFFAQIVAGDSWARVSDPLIRQYPWQAAPIIFGALFSVNLGVLNLILAVIVDRAQQAHSEDLRHFITVKAAEYQASIQRLLNIVQCMDNDGNGQVTEDELLVGYDTHAAFRQTLEAMDISKEDMGIVFNILDADKSGSIDYQEFAMQLHKMKTSDSHTLLIFIQHYVKELREKVSQQLHMLGEALENKVADTNAKVLQTMRSSLCEEFEKLNESSPIGGDLLKKTSEHSLEVKSALGETTSLTILTQAPAVESGAELAQLRQAVSELTIAINAASQKNVGAGLDMLKPKRADAYASMAKPSTPTLLSWTPGQESSGCWSDGPRACAGNVAARPALPEMEQNMQPTRCCEIRCRDGLLPVKIV